MRKARFFNLFILLATLILAACSSNQQPTFDDTFLLSEEASSLEAQHLFIPKGPIATYKITIENLSKAQPFTPPVAATHPSHLRLFVLGKRSTQGVKEIAENGNVMLLANKLANSRLVTDSLVALGNPGDPPPILAGAKRSFEIKGRTQEVVSFVSMLVCTNDGFTGTTARLPNHVGAKYSLYTVGYDAGTEINTEAFPDLVPPCAQLTLGEDKGGTDKSNPALAENSVTKFHRNIVGNADLIQSLHGWSEPVAKITIERIK